MKGRALVQAVVGVLVFLVLVWFINSKASSVDWEHVFVLRVAILGLLSISLMIWSTKNQGSFKKTVEHKWFGYILGFAVVALLLYIYVRPWVGEIQKEAEVARVEKERARVENERAHPQFPDDTTIAYMAGLNHPGKLMPLQRELWNRKVEIYPEDLTKTFIVITQASVDTIRPNSKQIHINLIRALAFQGFKDTMTVYVRFFKD